MKCCSSSTSCNKSHTWHSPSFLSVPTQRHWHSVNIYVYTYVDEGWHRSDTRTQSEDRRTAKSHAKGRYEMQRAIDSYKSASTQKTVSWGWKMSLRWPCWAVAEAAQISETCRPWQPHVTLLSNCNLLSEKHLIAERYVIHIMYSPYWYSAWELLYNT